jgi:SRSO17 transposase
MGAEISGRTTHLVQSVATITWYYSVRLVARVSGAPQRGQSLKRLVDAAHGRWRIEQDYQRLKEELGLGHFEGRGWRVEM